MAYIFIDACIDVKDGECTTSCPVDCIYEGGRIYYIHPDECINAVYAFASGLLTPSNGMKWCRKIKTIYEDYSRVFGPEISNLGSHSGCDKSISTSIDHSLVSAFPPISEPNLISKFGVSPVEE